jgi:FG-GAP-like repeat
VKKVHRTSLRKTCRVTDTSAGLALRAGLVGVLASLAATTSVLAPSASGNAGRPIQSVAGIKLTKQAFSKPAATCNSRFQPHELRHTTHARGSDVLPYDTNGSGLAVGDLDADGKLDLVLGDLRSTTSVLWNQGSFTFDRRSLDDSEGGLSETATRSVAIVDLDHDGRLDIATTHTGGGVSVWVNRGNRTFRSSSIDEIIAPAYALLTDDIDGDGDILLRPHTMPSSNENRERHSSPRQAVERTSISNQTGVMR